MRRHECIYRKQERIAKTFECKALAEAKALSGQGTRASGEIQLALPYPSCARMGHPPKWQKGMLRPNQMSLATSIDSRLWASVQNAYEAGNYTGAILDSIHYLSELIRNKSGLDSDGHPLVGGAFGGQNPIIKVNALHTESEKDEQRGVEFLLRGVYTAIRNPRSHEKRTDSSEVADTIISFINYLVGLIDKSRSPFDKQEIIERVFDKHFAQNDKYADLLVGKIPQRKRLDVLVEIFGRRTEGNGASIACFTKASLRTLSGEEQTTFWQIVSEALENASADAEFRSAIQIAEHEWLKVSEIARLRA
jgi:uncharacterized protein (TIGR02391 family)